jgi:disulfide bond formation protein DsbB
VTLFFALLALVAGIGAVVVTGVVVASRRSEAAADTRDGVGRVALGFGAAIATTATLGSLYLSEVAHFTPCTLCWYQRIAMYPLAVLLVLAAVRRDWAVRPYALALALIGIPISAYHVLLERFPTLESDICSTSVPCTLIWVEELGFVTIPTMALAGFLAVAALLAAGPPPERTP